MPSVTGLLHAGLAVEVPGVAKVPGGKDAGRIDNRKYLAIGDYAEPTRVHLILRNE